MTEIISTEIDLLLHNLKQYLITSTAVIYDRYSEVNCSLKKYLSATTLETQIVRELQNNRKTLKFSIHFPSSNIPLKINKMEVFGKYSLGPEFRELIEGPGIIMMDLYYLNETDFFCSLTIDLPNDSLDFSEEGVQLVINEFNLLVASIKKQ